MSARSGRDLLRLPLTRILPLAMAATVLCISLTLTFIGVTLLQRYNEDSVEQKASIFLDAMAGHVAQEHSINSETVAEALINALRYPSVLKEESVAVRWMEKGQAMTLHFPEDAPEARLKQALDETSTVSLHHPTFRIEVDGKAILTQSYEHNGDMFSISAVFDASDVQELNRNALNSAIVINITIAVLAALIAFLVTHRALSPLRYFTDRLAGSGAEISPSRSAASKEVADLEAALVLRQQGEELRTRTIQRIAQAERDALLARVAATLAHEVRNPLAGILNALSTFRRYGDDRKVRDETLDIIEGGLRSIERIAEVTLSTYRRRTGHQDLSGQDILDLQLLIAPEIRKKNLRMEWTVPAELVIRADADAVRQILLNLLLNACKASPEGSKISLDAQLASDTIRLSVSNEGAGIPSVVLSYLQAGASNNLPPTRELGIWIVSVLAEDIGARLNVESRSGHGTTVTLILPGAVTENGAEQ